MLLKARTARELEYLCSFGTYSFFGMEEMASHSFCLRYRKGKEKGLLGIERIALFSKTVCLHTWNGQNLSFFGTIFGILVE